MNQNTLSLLPLSGADTMSVNAFAAIKAVWKNEAIGPSKFCINNRYIAFSKVIIIWSFVMPFASIVRSLEVTLTLEIATSRSTNLS
jgi:hypothetical protein